MIRIFNGSFPEGRELNESYLNKNMVTKGNITVQLGPQEYFVLGDNRSFSSDSRYWGSLPEDYLVGRAWLRAWPLNEASVL